MIPVTGQVLLFLLPLQAALPEVQDQYQGVLKEIKGLQQQEHALQEESLSVRLRVEQIETTITEHNNKIKHWHKEVGGRCELSSESLSRENREHTRLRGFEEESCKKSNRVLKSFAADAACVYLCCV